LNDNKPKILLHACCAVCLGYPILLLSERFQPVVFFSNSNIYPSEEYDRRKNELVSYCENKGYEYLISEYAPEKWYKFIEGLESEPEKGLRCNKCFEFRLIESAQKAVELGISAFTTTLTVSPHKVSQNIFKVANCVAQNYGLEFVEYDFKKNNGFVKTMQIAKENNFYRQQYCGCEYSIRT